MGWEPLTFCKECDEPFDVYAAPEQRVCESCLEILAIDAAQAQERFERAAQGRLGQEVRKANDFMDAMNATNPGAAHEPR